MRGRIIKIAVACLALWFVSRRVDFSELSGVVASAHFGLLGVAFLLYLLGQVMSGYRWWLVARALGFEDDLWRTIVSYYIGMFFGLFGPSTLGGDVVRGLYLAEGDGRRAVALNSVIFDRGAGLFVLILVAATSTAAFGSFGLPAALSALTVAVGMGLVLGWLLLPRIVGVCFGLGHSVRRALDGDLAPLFRDRSMLAGVVGVSVVFHCLQVLAAILVGWSLGLTLPARAYFVFNPLAAIFSALPISLAGIGIREMGYLYLLSEVGGESPESAIAFGVLVFGIIACAALVGGLVFLASGRTLPRIMKAATES